MTENSFSWLHVQDNTGIKAIKATDGSNNVNRSLQQVHLTVCENTQNTHFVTIGDCQSLVITWMAVQIQSAQRSRGHIHKAERPQTQFTGVTWSHRQIKRSWGHGQLLSSRWRVKTAGSSHTAAMMAAWTLWRPPASNEQINQSNFYNANIPGGARLSGTTAKSVFNSKTDEAVP